MNYVKKVLASIRQADSLFSLFHPSDKVLLGVSGGKDSVALAFALSIYQKYAFVDFTFEAAILDLGFPSFDPNPLIPFFKKINIKLHIIDAKSIYPILKKNMTRSNKLPCSICSKMKKAAINKAALDLGFHKVAFAHHADDAIETLFLNMSYGGKIATFSPKMFLTNTKIEFIRPFILTREKDIENIVKQEKMPVLPSLCPNDKQTMRAKMKDLTNEFYSLSKETYQNFLTMLFNDEQVDLWDNKLFYKIENSPLSLKKVMTKNDTLIMLNIRQEVFINEQNVTYEDEFDGSDLFFTHYLIYLKDEPIGTFRYREIEPSLFKLSRIALLKKERKKGYGKLALTYLINYLTLRKRPITFTLDAQLSAIPFYEKLGFQKEGDIFLDANIEHIKMNLFKK